MANKNKNNQVLVERETYEKDGNTYFSHVVKGVIRGKEVKATVVPHDVGGYAILDIVFGDAMTAELVLKPYEIKDEKTKKTVKGNSCARWIPKRAKFWNAPSSHSAVRTKPFSV